MVDRYHTSGTAVQQVGWKVLDIAPARRTGRCERPARPCLPALKPGDPQEVVEVEAVRKKTRPPKRFTEGTLLTAMETAGKTLDEKELSDAMKETGLGTPATRAAIIEVLLKRGYIVRSGKSLEATDKGIRLIETVHPEVKSPAMTGQWEAYLTRIQRGQGAACAVSEGHRGVRARGGGQGRAAYSPRPKDVDRRPSRAHADRQRSALNPPARRRSGQWRHALDAAPSRLRLLLLPAESGSGLPGGCRWERRAAGHADRLGQVAVLPVAGDRARWNHAGDQPADRVDGRPGRQAQGAGFRRGAHPLRPRARRLPPGLHRLPERQTAVPVHRAGTAARGGLPRDAGQAKALADRHRRSALHFPMGARFPPGLPHARPVPADVASRAGHCAHRHGHAAGAGRHRRPTGAGAGGAFHPRFPARQHRHRSGGGGARLSGPRWLSNCCSTQAAGRPSCTLPRASRPKAWRRTGRALHRRGLSCGPRRGASQAGRRRGSWRASWK